MSTETLYLRKELQKSDASWWNQFKNALSGDFVPRNLSGVVTANAGSFGQTTFEWIRAYIASGYWTVGDIKIHHDYNGTVYVGQGWMLMDGRIVSQANYDTEHGAGSWATYIGSSPLNGKYLPNRVNRFGVGSYTTLNDGTTPITTVGNASHQVNMRHNHQWFKFNAGADDQLFNVGGSPVNITSANGPPVGLAVPETGVLTGTQGQDMYTENALSATQSMQPDSIAAPVYMRII